MNLKDYIAKALAALALCTSLSAQAVSGSTDYTGLWWNSSESGWGMNVIQQEQVIFITLFIYGTGNAPTWYVGPATNFTTANTAGDRTYTGLLYATTGTPFATVPFIPSSVTVNQVGNVTFVGKADGTATLSYTVNGATVNKNIVRQTWAQPNNPTANLAVNYAGANSAVTTGCANTSDNGAGTETFTNLFLTISQVGTTSSLNFSFRLAEAPTVTCTFTGSYTQEGRYGRATVSGRCPNWPANFTNLTWNIRELEIGQNFFNFQYTNSGGSSASCMGRGVFSGAKFPL
jgi:hypothetical protein